MKKEIKKEIIKKCNEISDILEMEHTKYTEFEILEVLSDIKEIVNN